MSQESVNGNSTGKPEEQGGIPPRGRRAFGCVTWIYMATLAFLAVVSLLMMPLWYFGDWNLFSLLEGPAFFATILFLPAIIGAAVLGARTYRSEKKVATRNGTIIGTIFGWLGYAFVVSLEVLQNPGDPLLGGILYPGVGVYIFYQLGGIAFVFTVVALFVRAGRRIFVGIAVPFALVGGLVVIAFEPTFIVISGALASAIAGAAAGWTAGFGYSRAGGAEMLPPGVTEVPRRPRRPRPER